MQCCIGEQGLFDGISKMRMLCPHFCFHDSRATPRVYSNRGDHAYAKGTLSVSVSSAVMVLSCADLGLLCVCAPFGKWDHLPRAPGLAIWVIPLPPNSSLRTGGRWSPQSPPGTLNSRGGGGGKGRGIAFAPHPILLSHPTRCVIRGHRLLPVDLARMHHYQRLASSGFERSHPFFGMVLVACSWGS